MKICIIGAGAIGGFLGARLALAGQSVTFVDLPGVHFDAIRTQGIRISLHDGTELHARNVQITADLARPGPQDLLILAVKAQHVPLIAPRLGGLLRADSTVMTIQNGIPWWYFHKHGGPFEGRRIEAVDPDGTIDAHIPVQSILGCIVYPAAEVVAPGVIHQVEGTRFPVGELDGAHTERAEKIAQILNDAGFKSYVLDDIRGEIWLKAWGNLSFNPISALTRATLVDICQFPPTRQLAANMMAEAQAIAHKLGISFRHTIEKRIQGAESVGKHKTSMLQDVEAGRPLEIEALLGAVAELGRLTETPMPYIEAVYACVKLLDDALQDAIRGYQTLRTN